MRIILGVAGGIAAYKACTLLRHFTESGHDVTVVPTSAALQFIGAPTWAALSGKPVQTDVWSNVHEVPHVRLGQQADLVVVAPATADLLAKAAHGLADDLLTNTLLTARCPVVLAPAMHTEMWLHPATVANVATLRERGVDVMDPASGRLTGADTGPGRLPEPADIAAYCDRYLCAPAPDVRQTSGDLSGRRVVITAGGTREPLDPVRYLGNHSSGKQGFALADAAARRGAQVTLIGANTALPVPPGVDFSAVGTTAELLTAVTAAAATADVVVMAAAPADFRPATYSDVKIKKTAGSDHVRVDLVKNPDIVAGLVADRGERNTPVIVSFAAETGDGEHSVLELAREKFARKGSDIQVVNEVGAGVTFGQDHSTVHIMRRGDLGANDAQRTVGPADKRVIADAIWDAVSPVLAPR